ncbi:MAG: hypothetical protein ABIH67_05630 [Candidatus Uhrbacteria bacterium]
MRNNIIILLVALLLVGGIYWLKTNADTKQADLPIVEIEYQQVGYQGRGFSFEYPDKYERSPDALWTKDRYFYYRNPRLDTPSDLVPDINIYSYQTSGTMLEYFQTLYETKEINFEDIIIGDYTFKKFVVDYNQYTFIHYAVQSEDMIYIFRIFDQEDDNQELLDMISSLKLE